MTRIGIEVVGAEACLVELGGRVSFPDGPLTGAEHADARGQLVGRFTLVLLQALLDGRLELVGHDIERFIPGDRFEIAILVVLAVFLAQ